MKKTIVLLQKPWVSPDKKRVAITFKGSDGEEIKASSFVKEDSQAFQWTAGQQLELDFYHSEKDGKKYLNFKIDGEGRAPKNNELEKRVEALEKVVFASKEDTKPKDEFPF